MTYRAVLFDLGGVVVGSPLHAIAAYEEELGIPAGSVNRVVIGNGADGAWARLERGELTLEPFYEAFDLECAAAGAKLSARTLMERVAGATAPRPAMLEAIRRIRQRGIVAAAVTNNWVSEEGSAGSLRHLFDLVVESAIEGMRKPDPRIFTITCERLGIAPGEAVFLDDIGSNLKTARSLGMTTIKVVEPDAALAELERLLGFPLR
jgi:putative hydrolase of the HAD superfamily